LFSKFFSKLFSKLCSKFFSKLFSKLVQCMDRCRRTNMNDRKKLSMPKIGEKERRILRQEVQKKI